MKVLVTGGAGFLGSHLVARLDALGHEPLVLDSFEHDPNAWPEKPQADVREYGVVHDAMAGCDACVHLASLAGVAKVVSRPAETMGVILEGTGNVLHAAIAHGLSRVVNVSTSEVYGPYAYHAGEDDVTALPPVGQSPRWAYATAKLAAEHLCCAYFDQHGLETVNLRPCNVYGPGQLGVGAVNAFTRAAVEGRPLTVHGTGSQIRSWCYVDDWTDALVTALTAPAAAGETINVGNPYEVCTTLDLARRVLWQHGAGDIVYVQPEHPDVEIRVLDTGKAARILGWTPDTTLYNGLARTLAALTG